MSNKKRIAVLTGAGVSKESGISTFRDNGGLWDNHKIEDVATPEAWDNNPSLVLDFYNERRRFANECQPNGSHLALTKLEEHFHVDVITQNVDNLHERAGSTNVLHLHGQLNRVRSENHPNHAGFQATPWTEDVHLGDIDEYGNQLRPHIVWFGEDVPEIANAQEIVTMCDILIIIGTSLTVYPASELVYLLRKGGTIYIVDPSLEVSDNLLKGGNLDPQERVVIPYYDKSLTTAENMEKLVAQLIAESL